MFYTLLKFLGWGLLLAIIGGCIGWALRALKCRGEVARAKSSSVDPEEVDRMRHRLANLEQVVAERDRLRIQLADVRHADSPGIVGAEIPEAPAPEPGTDAAAAPEAVTESTVDDSIDAQESSDDAADAASEEAADDEPTSILPDAGDADAGDVDAGDGGSTTVAGLIGATDGAPSDDASAGASPDDGSEMESPIEAIELDLDAASAELGKKIELDDLTVVEGIGPKISELCSGIGVTTWRQLADTDVADLQSMLDAAGSRYTVHKPGTWPQQAELLATGQWAEFKKLTDELVGGK